MTVEQTDVLVVGGGQAGLAMSEHLGQRQIPHLILERARIAERWHSERWDSLVANGPAWHDRFPGMEFSGIDPDAFPGKEEIADYFAAYAKMINAPIRCGVEVTSVRKRDGAPGFEAQTSEGTVYARQVVAATGPFQKPVIPPVIPASVGVLQIHSSQYHNPAQLRALESADGAVLVVGAGSSGVQIAEELNASGKTVYLSVGPHDRPPRAYRDRDFVWWLGVLGKWDAVSPPVGAEHVTIAVSGAHGGRTVDFRTLARSGITLVGRTDSYRDGVVHFRPDLADNVRKGDRNYLDLLEEADAFIARNGMDLPPEPEAHVIAADPECMVNPLLELDLAKAGVTTILWATGFTVDYSWLKVDTFDEAGRPWQRRGISTEPGVYFLGLPWQSRRGSSFIWGVWHDAKFLADQIAIQRSYLAYGSDRGARGPHTDVTVIGA